MICRVCKGPTTVYRTYGKKTITRERRCAKCAEQWESVERETPGTRARYGDAICSTGVAQGKQVRAVSDPDLISSLPSQSNPDPERARVTAPIAPPEVEVFSFPLVGGAAWSLGDRLHGEYRGSFPHLDVAAEYAKARAWLNSNPSKKKTPRGMPKFLFGWLERAQNNGRATGPKIADPRCNFHRSPGTLNKLPRFGVVEGCPECKHASARKGTREDEPTPLADALPMWMGEPATAEQLAELRRAAK